MDDLVVFHRHEDGPVEMRPVNVERVDHVVVAHFRCGCGTQRVIVSRIAAEGSPAVVEWPYPRGDGYPGDVAS